MKIHIFYNNGVAEIEVLGHCCYTEYDAKEYVKMSSGLRYTVEE